ncbi:helix-turn-helix domain-containing protein [Mucilaginibacter sp. NFR10]|uniref:helix-turn-helix domain-containing protein n=1 Tax=Mucilaginibacter sp. NFR10 TaxID=1566292 RepID=UPI000B85A230|nr:helix-turn-helix domain-containing protein [Mucilaginibacter sp. NFR10]
MKHIIKATYTDQEFRQIIREEVQAVLNAIPGMPTIEIDEPLITVEQAAEKLNLVKGTLYNMVSQNKIPYYKSGKKVLFKWSELEKWLVAVDGK